MRGDGRLRDIDAGAPLWRELRHVPRGEIRHTLAHDNHYAVKTPDAYRQRQARDHRALPAGPARSKGQPRPPAPARRCRK